MNKIINIGGSIINIENVEVFFCEEGYIIFLLKSGKTHTITFPDKNARDYMKKIVSLIGATDILLN